MSVYVSAAVWKDYPGGGGNGLLVLLALADQCDDDGWCYPSVAYLARKCRLSERAVQDNLARLETMGPTGGRVPPDHGLIVRHPRPGRSTVYRVHVERLGGAPIVGGADSAGVRPAAGEGCGEPQGGVRGAAPITVTYPSSEPLAEPSASDGALPGMPATPERWDAGVVVAAWCKGYAETHDGRQPPASVLNRVRGSARQAADCTEQDRPAVLEVAYRAGGAVRYDVVAAIADAVAGRLRAPGAGLHSPDTRNAGILARAAARHGEGSGHEPD